MKTENKFRFWIPLDDIVKSKDKEGREVMKLGGLASTKRRDTDGESLDPNNFVTDYLEEKGVVNWNHNKSPEAVIGEPTKVEKRKEGLYVESILYPDNPLAKSVYDLAQVLKKNSKTRRLGYSVEGKALERDSLDKSKVTKAMITNIALTISPKNPDSIVDIIKGNFHQVEVADDLQKSLDDMVVEVASIIKSELNEEVEDKKKDAVDSEVDFKTANGGKQFIIDIEKPDGSRIQVDNEYNVKVIKALDTASARPVIKEDVNKELKVLTKSEAVEIILETNPVISIEKAINIYEQIKNTAMKTNKGKVTDELLEKALSDLNGGEDIQKSNEEEVDEQEDLEKSESSEEDDEDITKGEEDDDEEDDEEEEGGNEEDEENEEGGDEDDDMYEEEKEEKQEKKTASKPSKSEKKPEKKIEKSAECEEKIEKGIGTSSKKNNVSNTKNKIKEPSTSDLMKSIAQDSIRMRQSFKAVGTLIKGVFDEMNSIRTELSSVNDELEKANIELSETKQELIKCNEIIDDLSQQPATMRKSISTSKPKERSFEKSISNDELSQEDGPRKTSISKSKHRNHVIAMLDKQTFSKGFNEEFAKALTSFEATGNLAANVKRIIEKENNITIVE